MSAQAIASIAEYLVLIATLLIGALLGMIIEGVRIERARRAWREKKQAGLPSEGGERAAGEPFSARPDAADQLRIVMDASYSIQPLLNKSETRLFKELDRMVIERNPGWQVMAQVSLGEILRCKDPKGYACINSKRVDLLIVDDTCRPLHVVEYQGTGHHQGTAAARDAVKKEALRKAGISYHEVISGRTTPSDLRRLVEALVPRSEMEESRPPLAAE